MEINGSQGATKQENELNQLNIRYWRSVIEMALASGQDEREWCRVNGVAINSYEKYRNLLRNVPTVRPCRQPFEQASKDIIPGHVRT